MHKSQRHFLQVSYFSRTFTTDSFMACTTNIVRFIISTVLFDTVYVSSKYVSGFVTI